MGEVRVTRDVAGVSHVWSFEAVDSNANPVQGPRVAIVGQMHGNEPVGWQAICRFRERCQGRLRAGSVLTVRANVDAMSQGRRYTDGGRDMNRLWGPDTLARLGQAPAHSLCSEERRVLEIAPVLRTADVILDLHSTSQPSPPHLIFRDDFRHAAIAVRLGVHRLITGVHEGGVLEGNICSDFDLPPGATGARLGFTLEAGQHTQRENVDRAWEVVVRLLSELGMWDAPPPPADVEPEVYEVIGRYRQAPAAAEPYHFVWTDQAQRSVGRERRLASFERIEADEVLLRRGADEVVRAQAPFTLLMPAPTAGPGEDLFYFTQRRHGAADARPVRDDDALAQAQAIERVLDLLADDEAEQGVVQVGFAGRRTLDLCADLVARVTRLPEGHPHRRIAVVGRGVWGGDEGERRNTRRYQQAMRKAQQVGVPIDRVQLLRGASFGWLASLAGGQQGQRIFLSQRQPHLLSLLVCGDLARGLAEGSLRHCRVAFVVEATSVEAGDEVRTAITRLSVSGARPSLLRAAQSMLDALKQEHRADLDAGAFGDAATLAPLRDVDGALVARTAAHAAVLRDVLFKRQLQAWRGALQHAVTRPVLLSTPRDLGAWIARAMSTTGILDADALLAWLGSPTAQGWRIDPGRIEHDPSLAELTRPLTPMRSLPALVLEASEVDRDNYERWIGWKRFLREVQSVPGARGRDLDLLLSDRAVARRLTRWYRDACRFASESPGSWVLVVAGDGMRPGPITDPDVAALVAAHTEALRHPGLRLLRVQHAPGTYRAWFQGLVGELGRRAPRSSPVSVCWETEHGALLNVALLARVPEGVAWDGASLEPLVLERAGAVVADRGSAAFGDKVGLFTEPGEDGLVSHELLHFGRAHVEGLLRSASLRFTGRAGPRALMAMRQAYDGLLSDWVRRLRNLDELQHTPLMARADFVMERLGVRDRALAADLAGAALGGQDAAEAGRLVASAGHAWPGPQDLGAAATLGGGLR